MKIEIPSCVIGVAVSGGMDSMALLSLYLEAGVKPAVVNVEHGIRGEASVRDSEFVEKFCRERGLKLYFKRLNVPEYAAENRLGTELAARLLRYEFFESLLRDGKVDKIALAHHADDNAETVLMREFRGTGLRGLRGVSERDGYLRPLLQYTREEIRDYVLSRGIPYVEDETNEDPTYTRNFIRHELLPAIKSRYPAVVKTLSRLSENAAECDDFISSFVIDPEKTDFGLLLRGLYRVHDVVKKYSVHAALREMGIFRDVEYCHLEAILGLKGNNSSTDLPFEITAIRTGDDLLLSRRTDEQFTPEPFSPDSEYFFRGFGYSFSDTIYMERGLTFDLAKAEGAEVRQRRDGDKFRRVNGKNKLLSDFLNERKMTKAEKDAILVLARGSTVLAVLGTEIAEEIKIDENTKRIIKINKEKFTL